MVHSAVWTLSHGGSSGLEGQLDKPDPREHPHYTTHANLGTFYIHRFLVTRAVSDLDTGIVHIDRAVEINPDAHFGREIYQREIARFVVGRMA